MSELRSCASTYIDAGRPQRRQLRVNLRIGICGFLLCLTDKCTKYLLTLIYVFYCSASRHQSIIIIIIIIRELLEH